MFPGEWLRNTVIAGKTYAWYRTLDNTLRLGPAKEFKL